MAHKACYVTDRKARIQEFAEILALCNYETIKPGVFAVIHSLRKLHAPEDVFCYALRWSQDFPRNPVLLRKKLKKRFTDRMPDVSQYQRSEYASYIAEAKILAFCIRENKDGNLNEEQLSWFRNNCSNFHNVSKIITCLQREERLALLRFLYSEYGHSSIARKTVDAEVNTTLSFIQRNPAALQNHEKLVKAALEILGMLNCFSARAVMVDRHNIVDAAGYRCNTTTNSYELITFDAKVSDEDIHVEQLNRYMEFSDQVFILTDKESVAETARSTHLNIGIALIDSNGQLHILQNPTPRTIENFRRKQAISAINNKLQQMRNA